MKGRTDRVAEFWSLIVTDESELWEDLNERIRDGHVVPIISNSVVNNRIFDIDKDGRIGISRDSIERDAERQYMIDEQLAQRWAEVLKYPLAERPLQLCRVAQYDRVNSTSPALARRKYLNFLKLCLMELAEKDEKVSDVVSDLYGQVRELSFSEIAFQLSYPRYENEQQNPLHLLAQLPLPIYVTTSHHDFIERALVDVGKHPRVQVCSWLDEGGHPAPEWFDVPPEAEIELDSEPTNVSPLVYHLYGLEGHPDTLVISEDDYMEFLVRVSEDRKAIPPKLQGALAVSSMLLLGYRLRCWDFRVLFRGVIKRAIEAATQPKPNLAIQLDPPTQQWDTNSEEARNNLAEAQNYLEKYLKLSDVSVQWDSTTNFVQKLLSEWRERQR